MKQNKKKGFTLVELLAVIVILAIILVIAVPKVMNVIEDSKKATLESTAKLIASTAEKAKIQNTLLGNTETITCESVAKINNQDYASCNIEFEGNTAKVTIEGSGKFDGLSICEGTKTSAEASDKSCPMSYGIGTTYITELVKQESTSNNGLIIDNTADKNIRYTGSNPNNYVYFNCKDTYNGKSYGSEGYEYVSACEVWRIIGIFDVAKTIDGTTEKRIKIVRDAFPKSMSWDSSAENINKGQGINQWGKSTGTYGGVYFGSDLINILNNYYIGGNPFCRYCNGQNQEVCPDTNDCANSIAPLSNSSLNMFEETLWYTGTIVYPEDLQVSSMYSEDLPVSTMYVGERSTQIGKICSIGDYCNDTVIRTTEWVGKIGLIYPSDYAYASSDEACVRDILGSNSSCNKNNWLYTYNLDYWTITPCSLPNNANGVWVVGDSYNISYGIASSSMGVRPTLYLKSNIQIVGGNGGDEPFILK